MLRKLFILSLILSLAALVIVGINSYLSPRDKLEKADLIVAVSGGDTPARAGAAIWLYEQGWASKILFSGAASDPDSPSNAEAMRRLAVASGVPKEDIIIEEYSSDTAQNARHSEISIEQLGAEKVILVTSQYHQRRVFREFENALGSDVELINFPAQDEQWDERWWWASPYGWYLVGSELAKNLFLTFTL